MILRHRSLSLALAGLLASSVAAAQPAKPSDKSNKSDKPDKTDAKALLQSGLKLFAAKDYLGALAVFKDAYARFPSAKILLNIGTTLTRLGRKADAANVYQRYLDASDSDPAKRPEVAKVLAGLDEDVGIVALSITPSDAEIQIGTDDWLPAAEAARYRVAPGSVTVRARREGYEPGETSAIATAGATAQVALALEATPVRGVDGPGGADPEGLGVSATARPAARSRIGALVLAHVDVTHSGGAGLVGITVDVTRRLQAQATALLGGTAGGYLGATFALLDGRFRPLLAAGLPVFVSDGARIAVRGAGGLELVVSPHLSVIAELGVEHLLNPEPNVAATMFVPAIGAAGRL